MAQALPLNLESSVKAQLKLSILTYSTPPFSRAHSFLTTFSSSKGYLKYDKISSKVFDYVSVCYEGRDSKSDRIFFIFFAKIKESSAS